jgi:hypothetical protein
MDFKTVIAENQNDIAFIVGNGINRFPNNPKAISWDDLLMKLWRQFSPEAFSEIPKGVTITEFYDLLELADSGSDPLKFAIQKKACDLLSDWSFKKHHKSFIAKAQGMNAPVLTTNFDLILPASLELKQFRTTAKGFSDFYPWTTYYGDRQLDCPTDGFGIWFINGLVNYHRSIRLGLSHYMGSVEKARNYIHKGGGKNLFNTKAYNDWQGADTWLHIVFNKPLCIFGLGLGESEVFIRWLLIERAKYFKKYPKRAKKGWYVIPKNENPDAATIGKLRFLKGLGFDLVEAEDYADIYEKAWQ